MLSWAAAHVQAVCSNITMLDRLKPTFAGQAAAADAPGRAAVARLEAVRLCRALLGRLPLPAREDVVREVLRLRPRLRAPVPRMQLQGPPALLDQDLPLRGRMCARTYLLQMRTLRPC